MKYLALGLLLLCLIASVQCQESEEDKPDGEDNWWARFKQRVKTVLSKWRDDIRLLWDDVLAKADDMRGWTSDMFNSFKRKLKEWLETRSDVPDDEKNEIESFISKLKVPTEKPSPKPKVIDP
jgi:hypothetical protein